MNPKTIEAAHSDLKAYRKLMARPQERFTDEQVAEIRHWQAKLKGQLSNPEAWQEAAVWLAANANFYGDWKYRVHSEELMKANK